MQVNRLMLCDVIEFGHGVMIVNTVNAHAAMVAAKNQCIPLIRAEPTTCAEFLARYMYERSRGKSWQDAKAAALEGANIVREHGLERALG